MLIASLFALVLAADDAPLATAPAARPAPALAAQPNGTAANAPEARRDPDIPATAPTDDYGFVAWCHGALSGHMELAEKVKPELDKISPNSGGGDAEQTKAGREYLELYTRALREAEKASPSNAHARGVAASASGYRIWSAARAADPRTQMWSYLMWELPPRCEIAAKRLEERSTLMAEALRPNSGPVQGPPAVAPGPPLEPFPASPQEAPPSALPPIGGGLRGPE